MHWSVFYFQLTLSQKNNYLMVWNTEFKHSECFDGETDWSELTNAICRKSSQTFSKLQIPSCNFQQKHEMRKLFEFKLQYWTTQFEQCSSSEPNVNFSHKVVVTQKWVNFWVSKWDKWRCVGVVSQSQMPLNIGSMPMSSVELAHCSFWAEMFDIILREIKWKAKGKEK